MYLPPPGPGIAGRFRSVVNGLLRALGNHSAENRAAGPLVHVIFYGLLRRIPRFEALATGFEAGVPPPLRRVRPERAPSERATAGGAARARPAVVVPRSRAWLLRMLKHEGAHCLGCLSDFLAEPQTVALIAADPRVARLLRPLWWDLSPHALPEVLRAPPRPAAPPSRAPRPRRAGWPASLPAAPQSLGPRRIAVRGTQRRRSGPPVPA